MKNDFNYAQLIYNLEDEGIKTGKKNNIHLGGNDCGGFNDNGDDEDDNEYSDDSFACGDVFEDAMLMVMIMMMIRYTYDTYDTLVIMRKVFFAVEVYGYVGDSDFDDDGSGVRSVYW